MNKAIKQNLIIYILLIGIAILGIFYGTACYADFKFIRIWSYTSVLMLLAGIPFIFLQTKAGLPNFLQQGISVRNRFLLPV